MASIRFYYYFTPLKSLHGKYHDVIIKRNETNKKNVLLDFLLIIYILQLYLYHFKFTSFFLFIPPNAPSLTPNPSSSPKRIKYKKIEFNFNNLLSLFFFSFIFLISITSFFYIRNPFFTSFFKISYLYIPAKSYFFTMPSEKFRITTNGQSLRNPNNGFFGKMTFKSRNI